MLLSAEVFQRLCQARAALCVSDAPVRDIARRAGISPYHFIRRFEAVFGATPHQLRIQARLDHARVLLARGDRSVTEVCFEVGFASLGSFSALFARRVGESPSRFRRRALVQVPGALPVFPGCLSLMAALPAHAFRNSREARAG